MYVAYDGTNYNTLCKHTFAQRRNRLTTHLSERIPVVKRGISVLATIQPASYTPPENHEFQISTLIKLKVNTGEVILYTTQGDLVCNGKCILPPKEEQGFILYFGTSCINYSRRGSLIQWHKKEYGIEPRVRQLEMVLGVEIV